MSFLRFLMLLALIVWLGAIIFFPVMASTAFSVLPTTQLAGVVVRRSLVILHWMGIISGILFLVASMIHARLSSKSMQLLAPQHLLIALMLGITAVSQFLVIPRMDSLRSAGDISSFPTDSLIRMQFNTLHVWSTRLEQGVLLLGLVVVYLVAREFKTNGSKTNGFRSN